MCRSSGSLERSSERLRRNASAAASTRGGDPVGLVGRGTARGGRTHAAASYPTDARRRSRRPAGYVRVRFLSPAFRAAGEPTTSTAERRQVASEVRGLDRLDEEPLDLGPLAAAIAVSHSQRMTASPSPMSGVHRLSRRRCRIERHPSFHRVSRAQECLRPWLYRVAERGVASHPSRRARRAGWPHRHRSATERQLAANGSEYTRTARAKGSGRAVPLGATPRDDCGSVAALGEYAAGTGTRAPSEP